MTGRPAKFWMDGWAGKSSTPCVVIGETPQRYRVKLIQKSKLPGRCRWGVAGDVVLMPKRAITFDADTPPSFPTQTERVEM